MLEKRWIAVPAQTFTSDGTAQGQLTVSDATLFKVKQVVILVSNTVPGRDDLEVKRIPDKNTILVGPKGGNIDTRTDLSAYLVTDGASIAANEQQRSKVPEQEIERLTYEEEPTVARRSILVDKMGDKIDSVTDNHGVNRLAVDGQFTAEVDVQVDVDIEGVYDATTNPDPDNIAVIAHERSVATDKTKQNQRVTAKRGSVDTSDVSMDVSLHDSNGDRISPTNPLVTSSAYEKFFNLISSSSWMKSAEYNKVIPTFAGNDLTLTYKEDNAILGEAVITNYVSNTAWNIELKRYLDEDDGSVLQDDDGSFLNLD